MYASTTAILHSIGFAWTFSLSQATRFPPGVPGRPFADIKPEFLETNAFVEEAYCRAYMMKEHKCWHGCRCSHGGKERNRKKGISLILTFLLPLPPFSYFLSREEATATAFHVDDTAQFRITMPQEDGRKGGEGRGGSPPLHTCQKRDSPTRSKNRHL